MKGPTFAVAFAVACFIVSIIGVVQGWMHAIGPFLLALSVAQNVHMYRIEKRRHAYGA